VDGRLLHPLRSRDSISDDVAAGILFPLCSRDSSSDATDATVPALFDCCIDDVAAGIPPPALSRLGSRRHRCNRSAPIR